MYVYFNPNPAGAKVGDCVVRAISKLLDKSWEMVYANISAKGLELKDMPSSNAVWGAYLRSKGYTRYSLPNTCPDCYTVRQFCIDYPVGDYLLATNGHVVTVIDGNYYDAWDSGDEVPIYYWRKER